MFWGVILESGKRYSQKVSESYHLSMACLEALPGNTKPAKKQVYVMVEHGETEYILCVLEYGRIVQQRLDVIFDCGEVVTYFLNGEGVVHLTGYALAELKDENAVNECTVLPALKASNEDEDDEEDEDWTPSKEQRDSDSSDESDESKDEESESESEPELIKRDDEMDQDQLNETNEDDSDDSQEKQKKVGKASKSKKRKISEASPTQNGQLNGEEVKTEKRKKVEANHVSAEDSEDASDSEGESQDDDDDDEIDEEDSVDDSGDEQQVSSAGRTPMPNRKVVPGSALGESPVLPSTQKNSLQKQQKNKLKAPDVSSTNKGTVPVTSKNVRKLTGNVQIEDLKVGKGPVAKRGKLVFFHYEGKFHNGKIFEKCETPDDPFSFRLGQGEVIKGLEIGLQGMSVGGKRRITIPPQMGYGIKGVDEIPPNSTLVFTVELKAVK